MECFFCFIEYLEFLSGGKFWSVFAAGALSSIAASAWSGGETITDNGNYTMSMTKHAGLGAGTGDFGMIALGTVSGVLVQL